MALSFAVQTSYPTKVQNSVGFTPFKPLSGLKKAITTTGALTAVDTFIAAASFLNAQSGPQESVQTAAGSQQWYAYRHGGGSTLRMGIGIGHATAAADKYALMRCYGFDFDGPNIVLGAMLWQAEFVGGAVPVGSFLTPPSSLAAAANLTWAKDCPSGTLVDGTRNSSFRVIGAGSGPIVIEFDPDRFDWFIFTGTTAATGGTVAGSITGYITEI